MSTKLHSDSDLTDASFQSELRELVDQNRTQCMWFLRDDYYPVSPKQMLRTLSLLETHGKRDVFVKASQLKKWLLQNSIGASAD